MCEEQRSALKDGQPVLRPLRGVTSTCSLDNDTGLCLPDPRDGSVLPCVLELDAAASVVLSLWLCLREGGAGGFGAAGLACRVSHSGKREERAAICLRQWQMYPESGPQLVAQSDKDLDAAIKLSRKQSHWNDPVDPTAA